MQLIYGQIERIRKTKIEITGIIKASLMGYGYAMFQFLNLNQFHNNFIVNAMNDLIMKMIFFL